MWSISTKPVWRLLSQLPRFGGEAACTPVPPWTTSSRRKSGIGTSKGSPDDALVSLVAIEANLSWVVTLVSSLVQLATVSIQVCRPLVALDERKQYGRKIGVGGAAGG